MECETQENKAGYTQHLNLGEPNTSFVGIRLINT